MPADLRPLVAIAGPTGSGKSELALHVAETLHGEVINCDSLQIYRWFNIGTAKLPPGQMRGIPHHLLDIADPDQVFTAGEYARRASGVIDGISARGKLPVIAGGTGFYLRAMLDGLFEGPTRDDGLRARLAEREKHRTGSLHRLLRRLDPAASARIHANDVPKVMRVLEVCLLSRRPMTEMFRQGRRALEGYRILKLGLWPEREALYKRLDARCDAMFAGGLVEEVAAILARGYPAESKPFESHGYKQALKLLRGEMTPAAALEEAQRNTRRYAKRQMTWFRKETGIEWLRGFGEDPAIVTAALERIRQQFAIF